MMEATNWAPEHSDALRELFARGMTFSEIAKAINSKFKTKYSRNATLDDRFHETCIMEPMG